MGVAAVWCRCSLGNDRFSTIFWSSCRTWFYEKNQFQISLRYRIGLEIICPRVWVEFHGCCTQSVFPCSGDPKGPHCCCIFGSGKVDAEGAGAVKWVDPKMRRISWSIIPWYCDMGISWYEIVYLMHGTTVWCTMYSLFGYLIYYDILYPEVLHSGVVKMIETMWMYWYWRYCNFLLFSFFALAVQSADDSNLPTQLG